MFSCYLVCSYDIMKSVITHINIYLFLYRLHIMSGSCKHQKRCGLLLLRLLYIFLNKIYKKKKKIKRIYASIIYIDIVNQILIS